LEDGKEIFLNATTGTTLVSQLEHWQRTGDWNQCIEKLPFFFSLSLSTLFLSLFYSTSLHKQQQY